MSVKVSLEQVVQQLTEALADAEKTDSGNKAAGTRVRKAAQGAANALKDLRKQLASDDVGDDAQPPPEIATVSYGPYMLYANFLHDGDEDLLRQPMTKLVQDAIICGDDIDDGFMSDEEEGGAGCATEVELTKKQRVEIDQLERRSFFDFSVIVGDPETGEEVELPPVRLMRWTDAGRGDA